MRNEFNGVVNCVSGRRRFLARFQDWCKNNMSSNKLTILTVEKIPYEKEPEVSAIPEIPEEQVKLDKGYYCCVYFMRIMTNLLMFTFALLLVPLLCQNVFCCE